MFTDTEGVPTQELCAIAVDIKDLSIVDIYHKFAYARGDMWARRNIHGLNPNFLYTFGFRNASLLLEDFMNWKSNYDIVNVFENCPNSMSYHFFDNITDLRLPLWTVRVYENYNIIARRLKEFNGSVFHDTYCTGHVHSFYKPYLTFNRCRNLTERVKLQHGYHCALYDTYELYLFYKNQSFPL